MQKDYINIWFQNFTPFHFTLILHNFQFSFGASGRVLTPQQGEKYAENQKQ